MYSPVDLVIDCISSADFLGKIRTRFYFWMLSANKISVLSYNNQPNFVISFRHLLFFVALCYCSFIVFTLWRRAYYNCVFLYPVFLSNFCSPLCSILMLHIHLLYANKNVLPTYLLGISTIAFTVPSASDTAVFTRRVGRMSSPMMSANVKSALLRGWRERWPGSTGLYWRRLSTCRLVLPTNALWLQNCFTSVNLNLSFD